MLTVRKGYDVNYYLDATEQRRVQGRDAYYTDAVIAGEPAGIWHGRGAEALGLSGEVDPLIMKALYTHGLDPRDPATASQETWHHASRFGNPPRNYKSADEIYARLLEQHPDAGPEERSELRAQAGASARQSVALYDLTLSASKSHTLMWVACERAAADAAAAGDPEAAARYAQAAGVLEQALLTGHRAMLDFMADKAGYARAGHHGGGAGKWVDSHNWTTAQFLQHDSREHDPHLHAHGPTSPKAVCEDGKVRTIDFSLILQWRDAAGAVGDRVAEAAAWQGLDELDMSLLWTVAADGKSRQIDGVDADATNLFSKRTAAITPALAKLEARFRAETGRVPNNREHAGLAEQASNLTRARKEFAVESRDGQLARWAGEYDAAFGQNITALADGVLGRAPGAPATFSERDVITRALAEMEGSRQSWTRSQLTMAVSNALTGHLGVGPERIPALLEGLTDKAEALAQHLNPRTGPAGLDDAYYRVDGESVFVRPHAARFATPTQILGEQELRAAAVRRGAPAWTAEAVDDVLARFARAGRTLSADQEAALRGILTSGAAVEVLNAPAGTGKSFLVGTLADVWPLTGRSLSASDAGGAGEPADPHAGDGPRVFGVAYGQHQAGVLTEEGVTSRNIRVWLDGQARLEQGRPKGDDETFRLRPGDMLVVDEAEAAANPDLVAIASRTEAAGVKLLLTGDTKQIGSPGAGGAMGDIAERGITYELAEVRRFHNAWEGPASLRFRDGDESVIGEYVKHGRLVDAGTVEQAEQAAGRAWLADTLDGRDALIVVGSNHAAARLSNQLRGELVRLGRVAEQGVPLGMGSAHAEWRGTAAGVGDLVQARRNAWHLEGWSGNGEPPINRQTYRVLQTHPTGGLTVARVTGRDDQGAEQLADPLLLPASYVQEQVTLAYASTVHAALGRTIHGAGYGVLTPGTDGPSAYVQFTRGTETNRLFVATQYSSDTHTTGETATTQRRGVVDVVADAIRPPEQDPNRTALAEVEHAAEEARATATHVDPLVAVVGDLTAGRTSRWLDELAAAGHLTEHHRVAVAADDARRSLDQLLRTVELAGHDPRRALADAVTASPLDGSTSVAQVLHFRLREAYRDRLTPQVNRYADLLPAHLPDRARDALSALAEAADTRRAELGALLAEQAPQWAREALGPVPDHGTAQRAAWEQKAGWAGSYRELVGHTDEADPLGAAPPAGLAEKVAVFHAAHQALDLPDVGAREEQMSEGKLRAQWAAWQRELATAPRYVADELEATHDAHRKAATDATIWQARADTETDPLVRDEITTAAARAREQAEQLAQQVEQLEFADQARSAWFLDSASTRDRGERARTVAGLNGVNLDDTTDRVTAEEWLDAHLIAQAADENDRDVTEDDLSRGDQDDRHDDARSDHTGDELDAVAPDLRDTVTPHPTERADAAVRRRVLPPDETTAAVDCAELVMRALVARREAEQAAAVHAAELEPEDEQLRAELARQAAYDHQAVGDVDDDGEVLEHAR